MLLYCLKGKKKNTEKYPKVVKTMNERIMLLSKCEVFES